MSSGERREVRRREEVRPGPGSGPVEPVSVRSPVNGRKGLGRGPTERDLWRGSKGFSPTSLTTEVTSLSAQPLNSSGFPGRVSRDMDEGGSGTTRVGRRRGRGTTRRETTTVPLIVGVLVGLPETTSRVGHRGLPLTGREGPG